MTSVTQTRYTISQHKVMSPSPSNNQISTGEITSIIVARSMEAARIQEGDKNYIRHQQVNFMVITGH